MRISAVVAWVALSCFGQAPLAGSPAWFDYDRSQSTEYRQLLAEERDGARIYDSSYASPLGGRVRAYTVVPARSGTFAGVVWQHGGGGSRDRFLPDAVALARLGAISILMDAPSNRPSEMQRPREADELEAYRRDLIQVVVDARRGYDVLVEMGVDPQRIAYVGHSFGAMMGGSLAGVDHRFETFILMAGLEGFARHYRLSQHPEIAKVRKTASPEDFQRLLATVEPIDAHNFIGKATAPILFQAARFDVGVSKSDTIDYFAMAPQPKTLKWYDTDHAIDNRAAFVDRQRWLVEKLSLK